jgi:hypothetical protein
MPKQNSYSTRGVYVNTTDATQTTAATFSTKTNKAYGVVAKVTATETVDFDEQAFYIRTALFKNDGGTLALVGSVGTPTTIESTSGWDVTLDASGTDIRVRVTGAAATVMTWKVELEVSECGKYIAESGIVE